MNEHYISLIAAYGTGVLLWFLANYIFKSIWKDQEIITFEKPWMEFVFSIMAVVSIIGIGQLYVRDLMIPNDDNKVIDAINQFLIFSPTLLLIAIRKQPIKTIWLPKSKYLHRLALGFVIAVSSLVVYWVTRKNAPSFENLFINTYHPKNISHLVQVFMEDITIALIFVRLSAWIGNQRTIVIVAVLFAVGHIPSLLSSGFAITELGSLFLDTLIGVLVLSAISKSKDVWWFFILHFTLDMSQFYGGL
jgi:uncharacterized membrane protein